MPPYGLPRGGKQLGRAGTEAPDEALCLSVLGDVPGWQDGSPYADGELDRDLGSDPHQRMRARVYLAELQAVDLGCFMPRRRARSLCESSWSAR